LCCKAVCFWKICLGICFLWIRNFTLHIFFNGCHILLFIADSDDDNDGIADSHDTDDDGDGVPDEEDEDRDTDGDGTPDIGRLIFLFNTFSHN
jgi:hypothetical protein